MSKPRTLRGWLRGVAIGVDQLANAWWWGNPDETISSRVGRAAIAGKKWGLVAEKIINALAILCGDKPDHCRRNVEYFNEEARRRSSSASDSDQRTTS